MSVKVTLSDLIEDGELEGYKRRAPRHNTLVEGIDAEVCAESTCSHCGHKGLGWVPFTRQYTNEWDGWERVSYRAFAECPACLHAEEF